MIQRRGLHDREHGHLPVLAPELVPQLAGPDHVRGIDDIQLPRPLPGVGADEDAVVVDVDRVQARGDVDEAADEGRIDGVVVAERADHVVPGQAHRVAEHDLGSHRRQGPHRGPVRSHEIDRAAPAGAGEPAVRDRQPGGHLGVEVLRRRERATGHEAAPEEPVHALDQAFGLRVPGLQQFDLAAQRSGERGGGLGQFPAADPGLVVPEQTLRNGLRLVEQGPHAAEQIRCHPGWQHAALDEARRR